MHSLCIYCQLHNSCIYIISGSTLVYFQSTSVSTVQSGCVSWILQLNIKTEFDSYTCHIFAISNTVYPYMNSFIGCLSGWKFALFTLNGFLSTMYLHVLLQICCFRCWKIALITFVGLYGNVYNMNSHIGCLSGCQFAVVTFVGFSSTMYLHMIVQICWARYWKLALITFVGFFSTILLLVLVNAHTGNNSLNELPKKSLETMHTLCKSGTCQLKGQTSFILAIDNSSAWQTISNST